MATVNPKIVRCSEEEKAKFFNTLCMNLVNNINMDKLHLNYIQRYKNSDRNGNSRYNYSFYGIDKEYGRIIDLTWQVANVLELKYDYNRMFIIEDDMLPTCVEKKLNKYIEDNKLEWKEIKLVEVI